MAKRALVDTDVLIDYLRGHPKAKTKLLGLDEVVVSVVTVAELYAGARGNKEHRDIANLLAECEQLPIGELIAKDAGLLKNRYFPSHGIELPDALIAATALFHGLPLYTLNVKHYPMIEGLKAAYAKV